MLVSMRLKNVVVLLMEEIRLTTWDEKSLVHNGMIYLSTAAGFLPSRVCPQILSSSNVGGHKGGEDKGSREIWSVSVIHKHGQYFPNITFPR